MKNLARCLYLLGQKAAIAVSTRVCKHAAHHDPTTIIKPHPLKLCVVCPKCSMHLSHDRAEKGCAFVGPDVTCPFGPYTASKKDPPAPFTNTQAIASAISLGKSIAANYLPTDTKESSDMIKLIVSVADCFRFTQNQHMVDE